MFFLCKSLSSLPDFSKWNTNNVANMNYMFCKCSSLSLYLDISKWNTNNMNNMFHECENLILSIDIF